MYGQYVYGNNVYGNYIDGNYFVTYFATFKREHAVPYSSVEIRNPFFGDFSQGIYFNFYKITTDAGTDYFYERYNSGKKTIKVKFQNITESEKDGFISFLLVVREDLSFDFVIENINIRGRLVDPSNISMTWGNLGWTIDGINIQEE